MARTPPTQHARGLRRAGTRLWRLPGSSAVQRDVAPPDQDPPVPGPREPEPPRLDVTVAVGTYAASLGRSSV